MRSRLCSFVSLTVLAFSACAAAASEQTNIARLFARVRQSPPELHAFLLRMPKGGDLHNHLSGAVYAESYLEQAAKDRLCITLNLTLSDPVNGTCPQGAIDAAGLPGNETLRNRLIDNLSMRDFVPTPEHSGADQFFDSFDKFKAASRLDEGLQAAGVARRAANQNESYIELMAFTGSKVIGLGKQTGLDENDLDATRQRLLAAGLQAQVDEMKQHVEQVEAARKTAMNCDCAIEVRYQFQVLRNFPKEQVFAQTLAGFMLASQEPLVVGVNFVQREDGYNSLHDYKLHMRLIAYAHKLFPNVHIALHAGELAPGLVPPEDLRFHIRDAVTVAGAERIGHGVDIAEEQDAIETLTRMREHHIDVEINLTSNEVILGVKAPAHPFPMYRKYGVPLTVSTDDEGVSRSDLTTEYEKAITTYGLTYPEVKQLVRNSITYSFANKEERAHLLEDLDKRFATFESWALSNML